MPVSDERYAESRHQYKDPRSGERVISVTSIVGAFDPTGNKLAAGAGAAVKLTKAGIDYRRQWADKRELGTRVHKYVSLWAQGKSAEIPEGDEAHMDAFSDFCRAEKPEWLVTERAVIGQGWGGKLDLIGWIRDAFWLLDAKSGKPYKTELLLQLAGYAGSDGLIVYDDEGMAVDLDPLPHIDRWGGLYLTANGWELVEADKPDEGDPRTIREVQADALEAFKHIFAAKQWAKGIR